MATKKKSAATAPTAEQVRPPVITRVPVSKTRRARAAAVCDDSCALNAHHAWKSAVLPAAYNHKLTFTIPAGKRFVIELVTAGINVPPGETVRLRMYTAIGGTPSNMDLVVTPQGIQSGGLTVFVATHALRAYADTLLEFNVNRDNATTTGYALICVSGYLV